MKITEQLENLSQGSISQSVNFIYRSLFKELIYWTKDLQDYKIHAVAIGKKKNQELHSVYLEKLSKVETRKH